MKVAALLALAALGLAAAVPLRTQSEILVSDPLFTKESYIYEFENFIVKHAKQYLDEAEKMFRFSVFQKNFDYINSFNSQRKDLVLSVNEFADLTPSEFREKYTGLNVSARPETNVQSLGLFKSSVLADSIDWRSKGAVTPVKNQGQCGSCWSFGTTGAIEGRVAATYGSLVSLSEQELIDCAGGLWGNHGCAGGVPDLAFRFAQKRGICATADYPTPYSQQVSSCQRSSCEPAPHTTVQDYADVPQGNEQELTAAVAEGPVVVAIEADESVFQFYQSGVISASDCGTKLDHAVLVVGYGSAMTGGDYYIVKNSWGTSWGESGYFKLARDSTETNGAGTCGIALMASYPIV